MRIFAATLALMTLLTGGCDDQTPEETKPGEYTATGPVIAQVNGEPLHQDMVITKSAFELLDLLDSGN